TEEKLAELDRALPTPWEQKVAQYEKDYSLSHEMALQLYDSGQAQLFESLAKELNLDRSVLASLLVEAPARAVRDGVKEESITTAILGMVAAALSDGHFAKEAA